MKIMMKRSMGVVFCAIILFLSFSAMDVEESGSDTSFIDAEESGSDTSSYAEGSDAISYEINISPEELSFGKKDNYDTVSFPGCIYTNEPGSPKLPVKVLHFAIDQDKEVSDIQVLIDINHAIEGSYNIYPVQKPIKETDQYIFTPQDNKTYDSFQGYPKNRVEISAKGFLNGTKIVTVYVYPLEYMPRQKKLILHSSMLVSITQKLKPAAKSAASSFLPQSAMSSAAARSGYSKEINRNMLNKMIANPDKIMEKPSQASTLQDLNMEIASGSGPIDYLIITNNDLKTSAAFQPLIDDKTARGLSVAIESVENIEAGTAGRDAQEKIRNYIKDKHTNNGLVWVLLGGDTDIVPIRLVLYKNFISPPDVSDPRIEDSEYVPCDMYYSCLDGDWDADGDGGFGEPNAYDGSGRKGDDVDFYADVFVGRAPVRNQAEAAVFVNKVLTYQREIHNYSDKILLSGYDDYGDLGGATKDYIAQNYLPYYFNTITKYYERDIPNSASLTLQAMNEGYHIINHNDHGNQYWLQTGGDGISATDIERLYNSSRLAIMYSTSCFSGQIDRDCIGEYWMRNPNGGGSAYIGMGRAGNAFNSKPIDIEFFRCLLKEGIMNIGQTHAASKIPFIGQAGSSQFIRENLFQLNLLGDPEMRIMFPGKDALITSPSNNNFVRGTVEILGKALWEGSFDKYELSYASKNNPGNLIQITSSNTAVEDGLLGTWDTAQLNGGGAYAAPDGEYILNLKVFAPGNIEIKAHSINVIVDNVNQSPEFIGLTDKVVPAGRPFNLKIEARDPDDPVYWENSLQYSADLSNLPGNPCFDPSTQTFSWLPSENDRGSYIATFTVSDQYNFPVSKTITLSAAYAEEIPIAIDAGEQINPAIYKNTVVWQNSADGQIYKVVYNPSTGVVSPKIQVSNNNCSNRYPSIYEDLIVWEGTPNSGGNAHIYLYNPSVAINASQVTSSSFGQYTPKIYGNKIVWKDFRNGNSDIYMCIYNPSTHAFGPEIPVVTESHGQDSPAIYGNVIAWVDQRREYNGDIYMRIYNDTTGIFGPEIVVAEGPGYQIGPAIYGNKIVWCDSRSGKYNIYMRTFNPDTGELGSETPVSIGPTNRLHPAIYNNTIAWSENLDIYLFDILTGEKIQLTNAPSWQYNPAIYQDKIVWRDGRNGNADIYMARICYVPKIASIIPSSVLPGQTITISGSNFGYYESGVSKVIFTPEIQVNIDNKNDWTDTRIVCNVPAGAEAGPVIVKTGGGRSNSISITAPRPPVIDPIGNKVMYPGQSLYIVVKAINPDTDEDPSKMVYSVTTPLPPTTSFNPATHALNMFTKIPGDYTVTFKVDDGYGLSAIETIIVTVSDKPFVSYIIPRSGGVNTSIQIGGSNFKAKDTFSKVRFTGAGGTADAVISYWYNNYIFFKTPRLPAGTYSVTVITKGGGSVPGTFVIM